MKKLILMAFILILITPLFAEDFTLKKSPKQDFVFNLLQFSACISIDLDTAFTYRSIWHYKLEEGTLFWRGIINEPELVLAIDMIIKVGLTWGTSKLYKKNKFLAYLIIASVNIAQVYYISTHLRAWHKINNSLN